MDADNDLLQVMEEFCMLSPGKFKPSFATVPKKGKKGASQTRGYAAAAAALSGSPAIMKVPTKKKCAPPKKGTTMNPYKLYSDSTTNQSMFVKLPAIQNRRL